ncbi:MAG: CIA30 family protein [Verrucomicrobiota bacterium]
MSAAQLILVTMDRLLGGIDRRLGRQAPEGLRGGDPLDFWRMEVVEPGRLSRSRAQKKIPGRAGLEYKTAPQADDRTLLTQAASFQPQDCCSLAYWHAVYPIPRMIFSGLIRQPAKQAGRMWLPIVSALLLNMNIHAADKFIFDFQTDTNAGAWQIVNDGVMGGVSTSQFCVTNGVAVFQGEVSLANNGGFASVRSLPLSQKLAGFDTFVIRTLGDGHCYKFTSRINPSFDSAIYQAVFKTQPGVWEEHHLPLKEFIPTFRGRVLSDEPPLEAANVTSVGFLISEQQAGAFQLKVAWIKASVSTNK